MGVGQNSQVEYVKNEDLTPLFYVKNEDLTPLFYDPVVLRGKELV